MIGVVSLAHLPDRLAQADEPKGWGSHGPLGQAKGIHPGRVVWVHDPDATDWEGYDSSEHWWQNACTDLAVVEKMVSQAIRGVAGLSNDEAAWDAIFRHFNAEHGRAESGYRAGEKIAIKINLTTCNAAGEQVHPVTYDKKSNIMNRIDNSPQMILALLRQLVNTVGVDQNDITIGDPTGIVPELRLGTCCIRSFPMCTTWTTTAPQAARARSSPTSPSTGAPPQRTTRSRTISPSRLPRPIT